MGLLRFIHCRDCEFNNQQNWVGPGGGLAPCGWTQSEPIMTHFLWRAYTSAGIKHHVSSNSLGAMPNDNALLLGIAVGHIVNIAFYYPVLGSINEGLNTLRPRQNGRHFPDDILKCIFLNENLWISINISLKFVPRGPINNIPTLVRVMAWRRPGDKPLSEPTMVRLPTHICVTRPQWVNNIQ